MCEEFVAAMQEEFEMSMMGELTYFLRLQVKQLKHGTFLSQPNTVLTYWKSLKWRIAKRLPLQLLQIAFLYANEDGKQVDSTKYRGLIGSLLYLTVSRSDIQFGVCLCVRFQFNRKESYFKLQRGFSSIWKGELMLDCGILMSLTFFLVVFQILTM